MNMRFEFDIPAKILFGSGALNLLGDQAMPGKKAMVLISNGKSTRAGGYLDRTVAQLARAGVQTAVWDGIMENPVREAIMEGAAFARENGCDFIAALGGGAVLDSAVAIAAMATNDGDLWDYIAGGTGGGKPFAHKGLPIVTIATTAGTGSEINCWGVISNLETREKIGFGDPSLTPVLAVVDPELMRTVPPRYTAYQGFDALFHNTEVMMSRAGNILSETLALSAIEHIAKYRPRAVRDGNDLEAREHVAYGSTLAGMTMQLASTTAQHSMEHAMSAYHHELPHGAGLIMISNAYWKRFAEVAGARMAAIARAMGKADATRPEDFLEALAEMQQACGVDTLRLADYGVREEDCGKIAENAVVTMGGLFRADPRKLESGEIEDIIRESI